MLIVLAAVATLAAPQSAPPARPSPPVRATPTPPATENSPSGADDFDFVDNLGRNGMSPEETDRISTSRQQAEERIQALSNGKKPEPGSSNGSNGQRQPDQPGRRPPH